MFEVKAKWHKLPDGNEIKIFSRDIIDANILEVAAGTNGYKGGDSGRQGSRTYFCIKDVASTDIRVSVIDNPGSPCDGGFEVVLGGDSELTTIIQALKFITKVLEDEANGVND